MKKIKGRSWRLATETENKMIDWLSVVSALMTDAPFNDGSGVTPQNAMKSPTKMRFSFGSFGGFSKRTSFGNPQQSGFTLDYPPPN